ncbi:hypothetical protein [Halocatena marina]|uniref:Uncharacterized protein n=1 Tax=Halocatena marina TaxID=2934937 RepID=A0ABD5YUQ2_9EURY|nr:hypothetical protein [Halocatena marina]
MDVSDTYITTDLLDAGETYVALSRALPTDRKRPNSSAGSPSTVGESYPERSDRSRHKE